jgi:hypothetical protein
MPPFQAILEKMDKTVPQDACSLICCLLVEIKNVTYVTLLKTRKNTFA